MSDAFKCDRCETYETGRGTHARFGKGVPNALGGYDPKFRIEVELCDDCWDALVDVVESYMEDVRIDERD